MKKKFVLSLALALAVPLGLFAPAGIGMPSAEAAAAKHWLQISSRTTYYGEVVNGRPHGRGTIKWGESKQYSGTFVNGKRSGTGKYINTYIDAATGLEHRVVYNGTWSGDAMNGRGTRTEVAVYGNGQVFSNGIQVGVFESNALSRGYGVVHAMTDPDHSFSYRAADYRLDILGSDRSLLSDWQTGTLFDVQYRKGSVRKSYSLFQGDTAAEEKKRLSSLKYLRSVTSEVTPILWQFKALSNRLK